MTSVKPYPIYKLETGTVIDHIPAGKGLVVVQLLGLDKASSVVAIGVNLESQRHGRKDVVKVEGRLLSPAELSKVALVAPTATISILERHEIVRKEQAVIPDTVHDLLVCPNPNCVTNHQTVCSLFSHEGGNFCCSYCERRYSHSEIRLRR